MQGRLMGAGSTCFHNVKGAWLKLHFFNNACKDCGVQGLVGHWRQRRVRWWRGRGAAVERCAVQNVQKPNQTWFKKCKMPPSVRGAKRRAVAQCEHTAFQY